MRYHTGIAEVKLYESREYVDSRGRSPFGRWFERLDTTPATKIVAVVTRMEAGNFGDYRGVGGGVLECRIHSGAGYRIYVAIDKDTLIILLGGGTKRSQQSDIANAQDRWKDYKNRKTQGGRHATHP